MSLISIINNLIMMTFQILQRHFKNFFGRNINMYVNNVSNFNVKKSYLHRCDFESPISSLEHN